LHSFKKSFITNLKKNAFPDTGVFNNAGLYFYTTYSNIIASNYSAFNAIFMFLSYLPEWLIMLCYGCFFIFIIIGLLLFNIFIYIYYNFINIPQLFRNTVDNKTKWEKNDDISFFRITKIFNLFWVMCSLFIFIYVMPIVFTFYGLITPLYASYKINSNFIPKQQQHNINSKSYNLADFIKNTFTYKKIYFLILSTLSLIYYGVKSFGTKSIIVITIAILIAYFIGLYNNVMPENNTKGFTFNIKDRIVQAKLSKAKTLSKIFKTLPVSKEQQNILMQLLNAFDDVDEAPNPKDSETQEPLDSETQLKPLEQQLEPLDSETQLKTEPLDSETQLKTEPLEPSLGSDIKTEPLNPEPLNPEPLNPEPLNPEPLNPEPLNPEPLNPEQPLDPVQPVQPDINLEQPEQVNPNPNPNPKMQTGGKYKDKKRYNFKF
jgi:hypothetical protein